MMIASMTRRLAGSTDRRGAHSDRRNFRTVVWLMAAGSLMAVFALTMNSSSITSGLALAAGLVMVASAVALDSHDRRRS